MCACIDLLVIYFAAAETRQRVKELRSDDRAAPVAVLCRTSALAAAVESRLLSLAPSLPYRVVGTTKLTDRKEVSILLSVYLSIYLSIYISIYLSICLSIYLSICPSRLFWLVWEILPLAV